MGVMWIRCSTFGVELELELAWVNLSLDDVVCASTLFGICVDACACTSARFTAPFKDGARMRLSADAFCTLIFAEIPVRECCADPALLSCSSINMLPFALLLAFIHELESESLKYSSRELDGAILLFLF